MAQLNDDAPLVSVVMSVHNGAQHLAETLNSILHQKGCEFEFIVVNDGSDDDSAAILDSFAARDGRLRIIHQQNAGLTRALIRGCAEARGQFIARQDAGDVSLPGRLEKQAASLLRERELGFVSCRTRFVEPGGEFLFETAGTGVASHPVNIIDVRQLHGVIDGPSSHPSVMFRRDKYIEAGGYRPEFYFGQDWDLWYRLGAIAKFQLLDETLYQAQIDIGDISSTTKEVQEALGTLSLASLKVRLNGESDAEILAQARQMRPQRKSGRARISRGCYFLGECLRRNGNISKARDYFWRSIKDEPMHFRAWIRLAQTALTIRGSGAPR